MSVPTKSAPVVIKSAPATAKAAPVPTKKINPPSISVRLGIDRVVFLITDLQGLPELDVYAPEECQMRFHLLPGLLLTSPTPPKPPGPQESASENCQETQPPKDPLQIVCPLLLDHMVIPGKAQILQAAMENENPFYGLSMFAKILELTEYMNLVPPEISAHLPYELVQELFPDEAKEVTIPSEAYPTEEKLTPEQIEALRAQIPVKVNFVLPSGYPLPELYRGKIVRISLSLYARAGGLALNDRSLMLINSRSRPTRIRVTSANCETPADDYYQLRGTGLTLPATSKLPGFYEDYTEMLNPTAAYLERHGIKP